MQLWYLDVILSSAINEAAMEEPGIWTSVWLLVHAAFAIIIVLWLRWRSNLRKTETFHLASYLALSWNSSYFACRAIDLTLGHKEWEEGRQEDIAIMAAMGFASLRLSNELCQLTKSNKQQQTATFSTQPLSDLSRSSMTKTEWFCEVPLPIPLETVEAPWQVSTHPPT